MKINIKKKGLKEERTKEKLFLFSRGEDFIYKLELFINSTPPLSPTLFNITRE